MRKTTRALVSAIAAAAVLAAGVGAATARIMSVSNQNFRWTWATLTFRRTGEISCALTMEGSFHARTFPKVVNSLLGYVTRVTGACNAATSIGNLPWHVQYRSFFGTLPRIERMGVNIVGLWVLIREAATECLYITTPGSPAVGTFNRDTTTGVLTGLRLEETARIGLTMRLGGLFNCNEFLTLAGTAGVMLLGTTTAITLTLI